MDRTAKSRRGNRRWYGCRHGWRVIARKADHGRVGIEHFTHDTQRGILLLDHVHPVVPARHRHARPRILPDVVHLAHVHPSARVPDCEFRGSGIVMIEVWPQIKEPAAILGVTRTSTTAHKPCALSGTRECVFRGHSTKSAAIAINTLPTTTAPMRLLSGSMFITQPKPSDVVISGITTKKLNGPCTCRCDVWGATR